MDPLVHTKSFNFCFPLTEQGLNDSCQQLKATLEDTKLQENVKISLVFNSSEKPKNTFSVNFERSFTSSLHFNGLDEFQTKAIKEVFQQQKISLNKVTENKGDVTTTPQGGNIVHGNSVSFVGINCDIRSLRALFPEMNDKQLQELFK